MLCLEHHLFSSHVYHLSNTIVVINSIYMSSPLYMILSYKQHYIVTLTSQQAHGANRKQKRKSRHTHQAIIRSARVPSRSYVYIEHPWMVFSISRPRRVQAITIASASTRRHTRPALSLHRQSARPNTTRTSHTPSAHGTDRGHRP
jgi:hypothetical protein